MFTLEPTGWRQRADKSEKRIWDVEEKIEGEKKMNILVICTGNTCRSPMAEGILKSLIKEKGYELSLIHI